MGREEFESLDFFKFFYFFNGLEFFFHAFYGNILAGFEGVGHEDFGEGAVSPFGFESILVHGFER